MDKTLEFLQDDNYVLVSDQKFSDLFKSIQTEDKYISQYSSEYMKFVKENNFTNMINRVCTILNRATDINVSYDYNKNLFVIGNGLIITNKRLLEILFEVIDSDFSDIKLIYCNPSINYNSKTIRVQKGLDTFSVIDIGEIEKRQVKR